MPHLLFLKLNFFDRRSAVLLRVQSAIDEACVDDIGLCMSRRWADAEPNEFTLTRKHGVAIAGDVVRRGVGVGLLERKDVLR